MKGGKATGPDNIAIEQIEALERIWYLKNNNTPSEDI